MSFAINTNVSAMNVLFNMNINQSNMQKTSEQLSSGYKINSAADDAAGLAIATKMGNQINGLNQASQNAQDGLSMLQTMEGGVSSIQNMLGRMRSLALEASNGTATSSDRNQIVAELKQLQQEITRTANTIQFNTQTLLTGLASNKGIKFQVGANANQVISFTTKSANLQASALGLHTANIASISFSVKAGASAAQGLVSRLDSIVAHISTVRANIGAVEDRLNFAITNVNTQNVNLSTAKSRIMDTNMASAMTDFTKNQILVNAGISMLAQANQMPGSVLKLLG